MSDLDTDLNDTEQSLLDTFASTAGLDVDTSADDGDEVDEQEEQPQPKKPAAKQVQQAEEDDEEDESADTDGKPSVLDPRDGTQRDEGSRGIPSRRYVDYDYDAKGNVVNPKTGKVLYEAGSPANTMFRQVRNLQFQHHKATETLQEVAKLGRDFETKYNTLKEAASVGNQLGLTAEDQTYAMRLMGSYKTNPVQTLRALLTDAVSNGTDLNDIFDNVSAIQTDAFKKMLDERLKPITQAAEQRTEQSQTTQRVQQETQSFFEENPEAQLHIPLIRRVIDQHTENGQQISLDKAYQHVLKFAASQIGRAHV